MAKTIKFNLICNGKPIRTIEDLQENFVIEDVLEYYKRGLLQRWLKVRGYEKELEKVSEISFEQSIKIAEALIEIFQIECEKEKIEESVVMLEFLEERKQLYALYEKEDFKVKQIIDDYHSGYENLKRKIFENLEHAPEIKAALKEMTENYPELLRFNHKDLFWGLYNRGGYLAILCLLMNMDTREYYLPDLSEAGEASLPVSNMYKAICTMMKAGDFEEKLGENARRYSGLTDGYWKDLEEKGKEYMILKMGQGDYVRSAGKTGGDLSCKDIENNFIIVDGIDYKSSSASRVLLYMEV